MCHSRPRADAGLPAGSPGPAYPPCSLCQAVCHTSPSSGVDEESNSSLCFGGKLLPFMRKLNLLGINSLPLRKGCHSRHPSPLQPVGPTLEFYEQFSATTHRVTSGKDRRQKDVSGWCVCFLGEKTGIHQISNSTCPPV